jgi:G3E family GTPase
VPSRGIVVAAETGFDVMEIRQMKTTVVCGLLGAGKTTFVRGFVKGQGAKTVVLVNDFGKLGIDGEVFEADGIESVELPSGCVCCTLKFDLITTIQKIVKEFSPEHLVIEPSGMASASGVLEALDSAGTGPAVVINVVDSAEFGEFYESGMFGSFLEDQIVNADVVLLNKTDLAPQPVIEKAEGIIAAINPRAILYHTVNARLTASLPDAPGRREIAHTGNPLHFETASFRLAHKPDRTQFSRIFEDIARGKYGPVFRAKALIMTGDGPFRFDSVNGKVDIERFAGDIRDSRLVVIGERLDRDAIGRAVKPGE